MGRKKNRNPKGGRRLKKGTWPACNELIQLHTSLCFSFFLFELNSSQRSRNHFPRTNHPPSFSFFLYASALPPPPPSPPPPPPPSAPFVLRCSSACLKLARRVASFCLFSSSWMSARAFFSKAV